MALEQFHFKGIDGTDHTLPKRISTGAIRAARQAPNELDMFFIIVEKIASPEALSAIDELELADFAEIMKSWMQGATAPNSSSSSS